MANNKNSVAGIILLFIIIAGDLITGVASSHVPGGASSSCPVSSPSPCWTKVQKGFQSCTINAGSASCTKVVTFSPAYSLTPFVDPSLNATCGANCSTAGTVSILPGTVPVDGELVFQASNTTWVNMPTTSTELNGFADQRLSWSTPSSFGSQSGTFCVSGGTTVGASSLIVQSSTNQASWTNMGSDGILVSPASGSLTCTTETISLSTSTQYFFRVMGSDPFGPSNDIFGTIELYMTGTYQQPAFNAPVGCIADLVADSTTATTIGVTCGNLGLLTAKTFTMDWWAGIPA